MWHRHDKRGSSHVSRKSTQEETPSEKYRRKKTHMGGDDVGEWMSTVDWVRKNVDWVGDRPSQASELLGHLQDGVSLLEPLVQFSRGHEADIRKWDEHVENLANNKRDESLEGWVNGFCPTYWEWYDMLSKVQEAAKGLETAEQYGFGDNRRGSDQKGPEAGWLKQFYHRTLKLLNDRQFNAVKEALDSLKRACELQQLTSNDCQSRSKEADALYKKLEEVRSLTRKEGPPKADTSTLSTAESELDQVYRQARQIKMDLTARNKDLEEALGKRRRIWKGKYPEQEGKSKSTSTSKKLKDQVSRARSLLK